MKEDLYNLYDRIINKTLVNIYSLSKEDKKILLTNFNYEDKEDKTILEIAKIAQSLWNFNIEISCSFFDYLKIKRQNKDFCIKRCKRYSDKRINVKDTKDFVSESENVDSTIYSEIYIDYYKERSKIEKKEKKKIKKTEKKEGLSQDV